MLNGVYKFWTLSVARQLILGIALVHAVLMTIFVFDLVDRQRTFLIEQNSANAQALAKTLAANGTSWLLANDTIGMEEIIHSQKNFPGLQYAMFLDMDGRVLGYTEREYVNSYVSDDVSLRLLALPAKPQVLLDNIEMIDVAAPVMLKAKQIGWARVGISRSGIAANLQLVTEKGLLYTLMAIVAGVIFAFFMARGLTYAIRSLSQATHQVAEGGREVSCDLMRHDELGALSVDFNRMLKIIKNREAVAGNSLARLNALLDSLPDIVFYKDLQGVYLGSNKAFEDFVGRPEAAILGKTDYDLFPRDMAVFFRKKDDEMLSTEHSQRNEEWVEYPDGRQVLLDTLKSPFYDENDELIGLIGVSRDITKFREQEEQLKISQKMEALGKLTGGIAHDYNNILGIIIGYAELLEMKVGDNPELKKYVLQVLNAAQRGAKLTSRLLAFSRSKPAKKEHININEAIRNTRQMIEKSLTAAISVKFNLAENLWMTYINSDDFYNALLNICINAKHAMHDSGELVIETINQNISSTISGSLPVSPGDYIVLSITDSGIGMDQETISKIFDPFFTSKGELGTGLGLSQVYGFIQRAGGGIRVDSSPGEGSTFNIYFPRDLESIEVSRDESIEHTLDTEKNTATVLIVDDEVSLVELSQEFLSNAGYHTLQATSGDAALEIMENQKVDVLFTDMIMPGMSGSELIEKARTLNPDLKILVASGYSEPVDNTQNISNYARLQKPFNSTDLLEQVARLFDASV